MQQKEFKKKILIDAAHQEETRVAVIGEGKKLEELDFEIAKLRQLKGNIYLAKVVRIEPSLQAAFIEYGGNRHGFLSFSEIHPDYFRIPVADREKLKEMQIKEAERFKLDEEQEDIPSLDNALSSSDQPVEESDIIASDADQQEKNSENKEETAAQDEKLEDQQADAEAKPKRTRRRVSKKDKLAEASSEEESEASEGAESSPKVERNESLESLLEGANTRPFESFSLNVSESTDPFLSSADLLAPDTENLLGSGISGKPFEEVPDFKGNDASSAPKSTGTSHLRRRRSPQRQRTFSLHKMYKIQEVLQKGQVLLIQVVKEERQNKGAAITTYLSLPGRYCVLMPNNPRGGGISRKITDIQERRKLKTVVEGLEIPKGMGVIIRTAGIGKPIADIKRDFDYLFRLWDKIREETLVSTAPSLVYEEADLIKRSIRDLYSKGIDEVIVEGEEGYKTAKNFMRMLIPTQARKIVHYADDQAPIFTRYGLEKQIESIHDPVVRLKSGGYLVINTTEALISIDINSGRATKERNIRETAYNTNLEAAQEIPRQLRLRDLAGLIVIDFIDMDSSRSNHLIEKAFREGVRRDRAKIQIGPISQFGLLELSRQRLRPSLFETHLKECTVCNGQGVVKTKQASALAALREIYEMALQDSSIDMITVSVLPEVALFILNNKRSMIDQIEEKCKIKVVIEIAHEIAGSSHEIKVSRQKKNQGKDSKGSSDQAKSASDKKGPRRQAVENKATEEVSSEREEKSSNTRRRRPRRDRRPSQNRNEEAGVVEAASSSAAETKPVEKAALPSPAEPKVENKEESKTEAEVKSTPKRRGRPKKADTAPKGDSSKDAPQEKVQTPSVEKENTQKATKKDSTVMTVSASVTPDSQTQIQSEVKKEVVQQNTGPKKKGWWGKLMS
jgi:ribonuclease E